MPLRPANNEIDGAAVGGCCGGAGGGEWGPPRSSCHGDCGRRRRIQEKKKVVLLLCLLWDCDLCRKCTWCLCIFFFVGWEFGEERLDFF